MNKYLLLISISFFICGASFAQQLKVKDIYTRVWDFGYGYQAILPLNAAAGIRYTGGMTVWGGTRLLRNRLMIGFEAGFASQPHHKETKQWIRNGANVSSEVAYDGTALHYGLQSRYFLTDKKGLNYYLLAGAGRINWVNDVTIYDPDDKDNCKVLESQRIVDNKTNYTSFGGGITWSSGWSEMGSCLGALSLDLSVRYLRTGVMDLMNVHRLHDPESVSLTSRPLDMRFIDITTNEVHTHKIGTIKRSAMHALFVNLTLAYSLAAKQKRSELKAGF